MRPSVSHFKCAALVPALIGGCVAEQSSLCAAPPSSWTFSSSTTAVPSTAQLGLVSAAFGDADDTSSEVPSLTSASYVGLRDLQSGEFVSLIAGTIQRAGDSVWFVPDAGALPAGAPLYVSLNGQVREVTVDDAQSIDLPATIAAPDVSSTGDFVRPDVSIGLVSDSSAAWYELTWRVEGGAWSAPEAWDGSPATLFGGGSSGLDVGEHCTPTRAFRAGDTLDARVRSVALDGTAGEWSAVSTVTVR